MLTPSMYAQLWLVIATIGTACHFIIRYFSPTYDAREPKPAPSRIPLVGHLIGLMRYGLHYFRMVHGEIGAPPAFSINLLHSKVYVICSANLISAVQRSHKVISFDPILTTIAKRMAGIKGEGLKLLEAPEEGGADINNAVIHAMKNSLLGDGLDEMNAAVVKQIAVSIDNLLSTAGESIDLYEWCRDVITSASSETIWGAKSPLRSKEVQDAFWQFDADMSLLIAGVLPHITASKPYRAREMLVEKFIEYYEAGGHWEASELAINRWKTHHDAGGTNENIARLETTLCIAVFSNTVPSTFWAIFDIFSRPELLTEIRQEILENAVEVSVDADGGVLHNVDLARVRSDCPLLVATFQETIRLKSNSMTTRTVLEDIEINSQYLLKKGSTVQLSSALVNRDQSSWGIDPSEFNPRRFLDKDHESWGRARTSAYLSWGSSPHMCLGRHFATGEILSVVVMILMRFDITPVDGQWRPPMVNLRAIAGSMSPPGEPFMMKFLPRKGLDGVRWAFNITPGQAKFKLVTG